MGSVSPQPVVTQVMPPGKSSVAWGRQTGDTLADSRAGVASLSRVMSSRMVSMLNLGFLKTWSRGHRSQRPHPQPGCRAPGTPQGLMGTDGDPRDRQRPWGLTGAPGESPCGCQADGAPGVQIPAPRAQRSRDAVGTHGDPREQTQSPGLKGTWGADPNLGTEGWQGHPRAAPRSRDTSGDKTPRAGLKGTWGANPCP